jgi:hypothetical protein
MFAPFTAGNLQGLRKFELDRKKNDGYVTICNDPSSTA